MGGVKNDMSFNLDMRSHYLFKLDCQSAPFTGKDLMLGPEVSEALLHSGFTYKAKLQQKKTTGPIAPEHQPLRQHPSAYD